MHFKLLFIFIFTFLYAQDHYQSTIGIGFDSYSARALSMGSASQISDRTGLCLHNNPSNISMGDDTGFSITSSYIGNPKLERRSIIIKDSFGDYLTETDYVRNINYYSLSAIGIKFKMDISQRIKFALGTSYLPYKSYNYNYKEEVRGSLSYSGPTTRDPSLGNHILESKGNQYLSSIGSSITSKFSDIIFSFGLSFNNISSATVTEQVTIDTTTSEQDISGYFSDIIPYNIEYNLGSNNFLTFGSSIQFNDYLFSFSLEESSKITKTFKNEIDTLYFYLDQSDSSLYSYLDLYEDNSIIKEYLTNYLILKIADIEKPQKYNIGFSIINPKNNSFNFILNYEYSKYSNSSFLSSHERYSIGIEHYTINNIPLRFGIEYKTSPFRPYISSISSFTFGSGYQVNNLVFDLGIKYSQLKYNFPDLFPVIEKLFEDLDIINESNLILMGTRSYKF